MRYTNLGWTPEGMDAYWELWTFEQPAFKRMMHAQNTEHEKQARAEYEAIAEKADRTYAARMNEIAKKYPGVPMP